MSILKTLWAVLALTLATPAMAEVYDWSQTPASNNTSDTASDVQWSEGMSPSDVNDSARAMMAELRKFLDDLGANSGGSMQTSAGSSTAYTLTTQGSADNLENGRVVCFVVDEANGSDPTMNVDSLGAKKIYIAASTALTGGEMVANTIQCLTYDAAANGAAGGWLMRNAFITVEVGGGIEKDGSSGALQRSALTGDVTASAGSNATTIASNAVTYAKMQDVSATDMFLGRDTSGSGDPEEISVANAYLMIHGADPNADRISFWDDSAGAPGYLAPDSSLSISTTTLSRAALTGDVTASAGSNATTVAADAVALTTDTTGNYVGTVADGTGIDGTASAEGATYTPTLDLTEVSSATWGAGSFTALTYDAGAVDPVETFGSGTVTWSAVTSFSLDDESQFRLYEEDSNGSNYFALIAPNALAGNVTCTIDSSGKIPDSCVGDGTDASGSGGDELGSNADRGDATISSSGTVLTIDSGVITHAKYQNIATDSLLGRDTAGTGVSEELSVGGGIEFTGSGGIQRSALTGDVTASAGSNTTTVAANAVALGTDTTGNYALGDAEGGAATTGDSATAFFTSGTIELARGGTGASLADPGADRLMFWDDSADAVAFLTPDSSLSISTTTISRAALTGDVTASAGSNTTAIGAGVITNAMLSTTTAKYAKSVGEIFAFGGTTCPSGSLEADGSSVLRSTYALLFTAISTAWGTADGTHFNLPDLQGRFLRGWDHAAGVDPDAASRTASATGGNTGDNVGSVQGDEFESHLHSYDDHETQSNGQASTGSGKNVVSSDTNTRDTDSTGGNETRPKNANVLYCIFTGV